MIFTNQDRLFRRCRFTVHTPIDRLLKHMDRYALADNDF
jgi:hypothetical protein